MDVGVADSGSAASPFLVLLDSLDPPTAALRDLGLLLDVDVDELAGLRGLDPADHPARFGARGPRAATPRGGPTSRAASRPAPPPSGPDGPARAGGAGAVDEPALDLGRRLGRAAPRSTGAVHRGRPDPPVDSDATTCARSGGRSAWTRPQRQQSSRLRSAAEPKSTFRGQRSVTVHLSPPGFVGVSTAPHCLEGSPHLRILRVNKVHGQNT